VGRDSGRLPDASLRILQRELDHDEHAAPGDEPDLIRTRPIKIIIFHAYQCLLAKMVASAVYVHPR